MKMPSSKGILKRGELVYGIEFGPRDIVNAIPALRYQSVELLAASLPAVIKLAS